MLIQCFGVEGISLTRRLAHPFTLTLALSPFTCPNYTRLTLQLGLSLRIVRRADDVGVDFGRGAEGDEQIGHWHDYLLRTDIFFCFLVPLLLIPFFTTQFEFFFSVVWREEKLNFSLSDFTGNLIFSTFLSPLLHRQHPRGSMFEGIE